ncbi:MAG: hypothetical protein GX045_09855, partial [Clostridiaceae bacterium]|nr:hypothetical protein [Clostridiaceae bacterium]
LGGELQLNSRVDRIVTENGKAVGVTCNGETEKGDYVISYTKFNLIDSESGKRVVVISFHKRNKPIDYLFRKIEN